MDSPNATLSHTLHDTSQQSCYYSWSGKKQVALENTFSLWRNKQAWTDVYNLARTKATAGPFDTISLYVACNKVTDTLSSGQRTELYRAFFLSQGCAPLSRRRRWCIATDDRASSAMLTPVSKENFVFETLQTNTTDWAVRPSIPARDKHFSFLIKSTPGLGPNQPPTEREHGLKRWGREADHSSPFSTEVMNEWGRLSTPPFHMPSWDYKASMMQHWWNHTSRRRPKCWQINLSQCHFIHHKTRTDWPGSEPAPLQWQAGD